MILHVGKKNYYLLLLATFQRNLSDVSNFKIQNVNKLKCKNFLIDFFNELGNFMQKKIYASKCNFFYILKQHTLRRLAIYTWHSYELLIRRKPSANSRPYFLLLLLLLTTQFVFPFLCYLQFPRSFFFPQVPLVSLVL